MGANDDREMLVAAKAECVRLERENAELRADLDARFEHSDHLSAKYYRRMRDAERAGDRLREQLDVAQRGDLCDRHYGDREDEQDHGVSTCIDCLRIALAEAQATIEAIGLERKVIRGAEQDILNGRPEMDALEEIEISNRHIDEILSAPSSTGGND